ncbi:acyl carrier protein [Streptomyces sp. HPF1205]|uniref:acyl carrier protein n=1 Tax=Streptomyces sp. HPF1205 TaxID=2873262 RepID=UPI001CECCA84|nr:acyl carrier protein [Streptomyces sp. HPF1205]
MLEQTVPLHLRGLPEPRVLRAAGIDIRTRIIERYICRQLEPYLHVPPAHRIAVDRSLRSQGVDSITALALRRKLVAALGVDVPAADLLRDDSVTEVAALLATLMTEPPAATPAPAPRPSAPEAPHSGAPAAGSPAGSAAGPAVESTAESAAAPGPGRAAPVPTAS